MARRSRTRRYGDSVFRSCSSCYRNGARNLSDSLVAVAIASFSACDSEERLDLDLISRSREPIFFTRHSGSEASINGE